MKQKQSIGEKILLLFADFIDLNLQPITIKKMQSWLDDDPRVRPTKIWFEKYFRDKKNKNLYSAIYHLKAGGYLKTKTNQEGEGYLLTPKGEKKILTINIRNLERKKNSKDEWIMIIFDIPETRRRDRNTLRSFLHTLGFQKIQQSVWVSPYEVYDELKAIVNNFNLKQYVKVLKVKEFGGF
ncbi:MAG: CRISPR-associated endonuclease Cas2 [Patescibacteria group bacterium]|nr:CRISPR-associated endonuclease Cas2 [Patescibacteria group bacterium]